MLSAKFVLADTAVWAPIDGVVANRKTNYPETQVGRMKVGDPVRIVVDTYPHRPICGDVKAISPAAGSIFALIPPDNASRPNGTIGLTARSIRRRT